MTSVSSGPVPGGREIYGCNGMGAHGGADSFWGCLWAVSTDGTGVTGGFLIERTPGVDGVREAIQRVGGQSGGSCLMFSGKGPSERHPTEVCHHQSCGFEMIQLNFMVKTCDTAPTAPSRPSHSLACLTWDRASIGLLSFGGDLNLGHLMMASQRRVGPRRRARRGACGRSEFGLWGVAGGLKVL